MAPPKLVTIEAAVRRLQDRRQDARSKDHCRSALDSIRAALQSLSNVKELGSWWLESEPCDQGDPHKNRMVSDRDCFCVTGTESVSSFLGVQA